jgi:hypothetical protein
LVRAKGQPKLERVGRGVDAKIQDIKDKRSALLIVTSSQDLPLPQRYFGALKRY